MVYRHAEFEAWKCLDGQPFRHPTAQGFPCVLPCRREHSADNLSTAEKENAVVGITGERIEITIRSYCNEALYFNHKARFFPYLSFHRLAEAFSFFERTTR